MRRHMLVILMAFLILAPSDVTNSQSLDAQITSAGFDASLDRSDWLTKDIATIDDLVKILPITEPRFSYLRRSLLSIGFVQKNARYLGFGSRIVKLSKGGGYASIHITMLVVDDAIAEVGVELSTFGDDDRKAALRKYFKSTLCNSGGIMLEDRFGIHCTYELSEARKTYKERIARYLGPQQRVDVSAQNKADYFLLIKPLQELTYGEICGSAASAPQGRKAMERLIADTQYDLIENVLRGYNPEGRIYAAEAILRIGKKVPEIVSRNRETIKKLLSLDIKIEECYGCFVSYCAVIIWPPTNSFPLHAHTQSQSIGR